MDCNVISISLKTGNQSAYIFALQSQLLSWQFNVPAIECTEVSCQQIDLQLLSTKGRLKKGKFYISTALIQAFFQVDLK